MLRNVSLDANVGVDTAENEPSKILQKMLILFAKGSEAIGSTAPVRSGVGSAGAHTSSALLFARELKSDSGWSGDRLLLSNLSDEKNHSAQLKLSLRVSLQITAEHANSEQSCALTFMDPA